MSNLPAYQSRDYDSIKSSIIQYLKSTYPNQWSDFLDSNAGMPVIDAIAYSMSILSWNLDKIAAEGFLKSAQFKSSVLVLAEMFGYQPTGRTSATLLVDVELPSALTGSENAIISKNTTIHSISGLPFVFRDQVVISPGNTTPEIVKETQLSAVPSGSQLNFIAGSNVLSFVSSSSRHSYNILPGMWIHSTSGVDTSWYRISSISSDYSTITLSDLWNNKFSGPFVIKTLNNDTTSSETIVSSVPYGTFPSSAVAYVNNTTITVSTALPDEVESGHYFRFAANVCNVNTFYKIVSISQDRLSFEISSAYGPEESGGFDTLSSDFEVELRSAVLQHGELHTEEFISTELSSFSIELSASNIVGNSISVYDESGILDSDGNPVKWGNVSSLALAIGDRYRSYQPVLKGSDQYTLLFGNGTTGKVPIGKVTVEYLVGGGLEGNVEKASVNTSVSLSQGTSSLSASVTNFSTYGVGGSEGESTDDLKTSIPQYYSTNDRAATAEDYKNLVLYSYPKWENSIGSISKVSVNAVNNQIMKGGNFVYISGWSVESWTPPVRNFTPDSSHKSFNILSPITSDLIDSVQQFLYNKCMITDRPIVSKGKVDQAVIEVDVQITDSVDDTFRTTVLQNVESAIVSVFNSDSVTKGEPVYQSNIGKAIDSVDGVVLYRMRFLYLDYEDEEDTSNLEDTPKYLKTCSDLYPSSLDSVVVPGSMVLNSWSKNESIAIYISGVLYSNVNLAKSSLKKSLETLFYSLRPGDGVSLNSVTECVLNTSVGEVNVLPNCLLGTTENIDIYNSSNSTFLVIDGKEVSLGSYILVKNQTKASENGVYVVSAYGSSAPWVITRASEAKDASTLIAGSVVSISLGDVNSNTSYVMISNLTAKNFDSQDKNFVLGNSTYAENFLKAVQDSSSLVVKFDSPSGSSVLEKPALSNVMYILKYLDITSI
jgi:hypothetical protein